MKSKFKPKPLLIILISFIILIISFVMIFFYLVSPVDSKDNEDIKVINFLPKPNIDYEKSKIWNNKKKVYANFSEILEEIDDE